MKRFMILWAVLLLALAVACGSGDSQTSEAGDNHGTVAQEQSEIAGSRVEDTGGQDEDICRVNMEGLAMTLMNEAGMSGSCPATLEEFQGLNPAYAQFEITCGGVPYEYETDGDDFTITCPNGHGSIHNDEATWSW